MKKSFYQDAEKLKNYEKRTLRIYHRQNNIRCIDCIADYIDDMFSDFCDEMDEEFEPGSRTQFFLKKRQKIYKKTTNFIAYF